MQFINSMSAKAIEDTLYEIFPENEDNEWDAHESIRGEAEWIKFDSPEAISMLINYIPLRVKNITLNHHTDISLKDEIYLEIKAIFNRVPIEITLEEHEIISLKKLNLL